jgi:hypothetical protein
MTYAGTHRNVVFWVDHQVGGGWKYTIDKESFDQYAQREHAITAAHMDIMLFEQCKSQLGLRISPDRAGLVQPGLTLMAVAPRCVSRQAAG